MTMTPRLRKFALTAHVTFSVGWLGAVVAYLALAIIGLTSQDASMARTAYPAMELIGWLVIVPCSLAALLSGLVQSLGTEWGLFRHYWILIKLLLTTVATIILLLHMPTASRMSDAAMETTRSGTDFSALGTQLAVHAGGGLLVLLAATVLSVYKPWGKPPYGRRKQLERRTASRAILSPRLTAMGNKGETHLEPLPSHTRSLGVGPNHGLATGTPWRLYMLLGIIGLILLFVILHLTGSGMRLH